MPPQAGSPPIMSATIKTNEKLQYISIYYRNSRWPPQQTIGHEVDTVQRKMAASIVRLQRLTGEDVVEFCRRRNRTAGQLCRNMGLWSAHWFARAVAWNSHLLRPRNSSLWSAALIVYRSKKWLERSLQATPSTARA